MIDINTQTEHQDKLIRAEIVNRLTTALTGVNVYKARFISAGIPANKLPAVSVYSINDNAETSQDEANLTRISRIAIALYVTGDDASNLQSGVSVDDKLDDLRFQVEKELLGQYETLNKLAYRMQYKSMSVGDDNANTSEFILTAVMEFDVIYHQYIKR